MNKEKALELMNRLGPSLFGNTSGAVIGSILGGPTGAAIGGVAGTVLTDFTQRKISEREKLRVSTLLTLVAQKIDLRIKAGEKVRADGFFAGNTEQRSSGEEIFEGIVMAAQREYEEKKLPYYANLFANIAFSVISRSQANLLIRIAERLSYRQLCLLAIFKDTQIRGTLHSGNYKGSGENVKVSNQVLSVLQDVFELDRDQLINSGEVTLGITTIKPAKMKTEGTGNLLAGLMELGTIPAADLVETIELLH